MALADKPLPVYGDGLQERDWLHVHDHCRAIEAVLTAGRAGETYNIGGECSMQNIEVVRRVLDCCRKPASLIEYVPDRPGHDRRYALDSNKIKSDTGWEPSTSFRFRIVGDGAMVPRQPGMVRASALGRVPHVVRTELLPTWRTSARLTLRAACWSRLQNVAS